MSKKTAVKEVRFEKVVDGTVKDNLLKVVWGKAFQERMTWEEAKKACEKLGKGWRLPTVNELFSLIDRKKYDPAIDTEIFPDTKASWYWTDEVYAGSPDDAWVVYFDNGFVSYGYKSGDIYVRPVRASK